MPFSLRTRLKSPNKSLIFGNMTDNKLQLFTILDFLDEGHLDVYQALAEDEAMLVEFEKTISWLIPHWFIGSYKDKEQIQLLTNFNEICNIGWWHFSSELKAKLLACASLGKTVKHQYYKYPKSNDMVETKKLLRLRYPDIKDHEVDIWCNNNDIENLTALAYAYGYQDEDIKALVKEYKERV